MPGGGDECPVPAAAEPIVDPADPRVAEYAHVGNPGSLGASGLFVAEGRLTVQRLVQAGRYRLRSLLLTTTAHAALRDLSVTPACPVYLASRPVMESLTGFSFHQGCLALAERGPDLPASALEAGRWLLGIEGVGNPDNIGGLFRTADAFGMDGVLLDAVSGDPLYRKAIRTSMGASVRLPFVRSGTFVEALNALRETTTLVALTPRASAVPLHGYQRPRSGRGRIMLLVGAESSGLSEPALAAADVCVSIPLAAGVDSLNVVVAAGIAMSALQPGTPS